MVISSPIKHFRYIENSQRIIRFLRKLSIRYPVNGDINIFQVYSIIELESKRILVIVKLHLSEHDLVEHIASSSELKLRASVSLLHLAISIASFYTMRVSTIASKSSVEVKPVSTGFHAGVLF